MQAIAIVGMSCRLPGANSPQALWRMLCRGENAISDVPESRWNTGRFFNADPKQIGKMYTKRGGFLSQEQIECFDAHCFSISPREAIHLDPQQRIMLELAWEAFEDAGIPHRQLAGSATGVYFGFGAMEYALTQLRYPHLIDAYTNTGYFPSIISNRVSYTFDLRGPSVSLDTACSSSLVAVHLACESLRKRESNLALAGGVCLMIDPVTTVAFCKLSALSPDGQCKTFDERANGYVRGEGAGIVLLKRLEDAIADGDRIYATILGEAVNQDGKSNGLTAPNRLAQEAVLRQAYASAKYSPSDVQYIEAHGTGTFLGDPIELNAIGNVTRDARSTERNLLVGSLKTNIGHLEAAAGVAGLIKLAMCVHHAKIPPHLNFVNPNPHIPFAALKTEVVTRLRDWPAHDGPRTAGISAFGFGGTNAHVVVSEATGETVDNTANVLPDNSAEMNALSNELDEPALLLLSARDPNALHQLERSYQTFLETEEEKHSWSAICRASALHRSPLEYRTSIVASSLSEASQLLANRSSKNLKATKVHNHPKCAFLFSGQGSQYFQMGYSLYLSQPVFRKVLDACDEQLKPVLRLSLCDVLFRDKDASSQLNQTAITQPAIFAVQWGLVELWKSWGITPDIVLGHSVGEIAAACTAGMLDWSQGLQFSAQRGALMQSLPVAGAMLAVMESRQQVLRWIEESQLPLSIAASNGPRNTVVSGTVEAVEKMNAIAKQQCCMAVRLNVSHAFHSELVHPILEQLSMAASKIAWQPSNKPYIANLTGEMVQPGATFTAEYLEAHARSEVCFEESIRTLVEWEPVFAIEIGPDSTLIDIARRCEGTDRIQWNTSLKRGRTAKFSLFSTLGAAFEQGAEIDWKNIYPLKTPFVDLPKYPFQRSRYWESAPITTSHSSDGELVATEFERLHPLLGCRLDTHRPMFQNRLEVRELTWLTDHQIANRVVFPGAAMIEMLNAALKFSEQGAESISLENVRFLSPMFVESEFPTTVQCSLANDGEIAIASRRSDPPSQDARNVSSNGRIAFWTTHCTARMAAPTTTEPPQVDIPSLEVIRNEVAKGKVSDELYSQLSSSGLSYGPAFRKLKRFSLRESDVWGEVDNAENGNSSAWHFSPMTLDACFHLVAAMIYVKSNDYIGKSYVPVSIARVDLRQCPSKVVYCRASLSQGGENTSNVMANLELLNEQGQSVGLIQGLQFAQSDFGSKPAPTISATRVLQSHWRERIAISEEPSGKESFVYVGDDLNSIEPLKNQLLEAGHAWQGFTWASFENQVQALEPEHSSKAITLVLALGLERNEKSEGDVWQDVENSCRHLHQFMNRASDRLSLSRIVLLTKGIQSVNNEVASDDLAGATLVGWFRTLRLETVSCRCEHIDLESGVSSESQWPIVAQELAQSSNEIEIAVRQKRIWVDNLVDVASPQVKVTASPSMSKNAELSFNSKGSLDYLEIVDQVKPSPKAREVLIRVRSTGLNFRDVLNVLGMYPGDAGPLGGECSGVIEELGEGVTDFQVGDEVVAIASGSFAEYVATPVSLVAVKPKSLSFAEAASLPIVTLTAAIALRHFGTIRKDDRVLIHAAAGGVGMAAARIAFEAGAKVYATAGTEAKRQVLRTMGATGTSDSRSQQFVDDFSNQLAGEKFDIVLNSLSGEFILNSLRLLKPGGAFIEIGKIGIWDSAQVEEQFPGTRYRPFDLAELSRENPQWIGSMLRTELASYDSIQDRPRIVSFPISEAREAFRYMAQAKQIGKIVITQRPGQITDKEELFSCSGAYIITGGFGSLGRQLISWMTTMGARRFILPLHRPIRADERDWIETQRSSGIDIFTEQIDLSNDQAIAHWIEKLEIGDHRIRGFFHLAGKLNDNLINRMTWESYREVLEAKAKIAWGFHNAMRSHDLEYFVLFSSVASLFGSPGQANYSAANGFLDGLAALRRSLGLPATSIQWGPWEGEGMAADFQTSGQAWGIYPLGPESAFESLATTLRASFNRVSVLRLDAKTFSRTLGSRLPRTMISSLMGAPVLEDSDESDSHLQEWRERMGAAIPSSVRGLIADFLKTTALHILRLPSETVIDVRQPLNELGLDSLMAVEMQSILSEVMQFKLDTTILFDHPTLEALEKFLVKQWLAIFEASHATKTTTMADTSLDDKSSSIDQIAQELAEELTLLRRREREPR